ncbi:formimidoylglutamate deiminase [Actinomadura madurae]|uniref:formimidoylglutamate deiminase n=1 Tax=Actinomadura madurae TaxID=1993 RepID=UPI0020D21F5E|nr:formimidoylglutamate deiminase [Actinomadura madurae]MCP9983484.1 formimidoylglutamate deiminase [Actinomadura madurae]
MQWHAQFAWLGDGVAADVLIEADGERITRLQAGVPSAPNAQRLPGLTVPGLANAHSHAFHRALRSRVQAHAGTFWTWREQMYTVADRLDPDSYRALAAAVFAEMALAGVSCVGEFHYLHHRPGGSPYGDPNAMGEALIAAAADAGIRITLLDACYLAGGIGRPLKGPQLRFGDGTAGNWVRRVESLHERTDKAGRLHARVGAAIHSVRAVPREQLRAVASWAREHRAPLHVHLSEQPAENQDCRDAYGMTPTRLLAEAGGARGAHHGRPRDAPHRGGHRPARGDDDRRVHVPDDRARPRRRHRPGPRPRGRRLPLCLGTDQHAFIDLFEEARAVELDERLRTRVRGHWTAGELLAAATCDGHYALGWPEAGRLEPGAYADLVTVSLDSVRTAGAGLDHAAEAAVFAATAADVRHVVVSGRQIVHDGRHLLIDDVPGALTAAVTTATAPDQARPDQARPDPPDRARLTGPA